MSDPMLLAVPLTDRSVVAVTGAAGLDWLNDLLSNQLTRAGPDRLVWTALLTPQGKFMYEMLVWRPDAETLHLDVEADRRADLLKRLAMYRLRTPVELVDAADSYRGYALLGTPPQDPRVLTDPRRAELGARVWLPAETAEATLTDWGASLAERAAYDAVRVPLGVPDGTRDLVPDKTLLLEAGFDALDGVDFDKGCYVGQEVTARMHFRTVVRKRLVPFRVDGPRPAPDTPVVLGAREIGTVRSGTDDMVLATVRVDHLAKAGDTPVTAGDAALALAPPEWLDLSAVFEGAPE